MFFALSGFLITYLLLEEKKKGEVNIRNFYIRRILRIWPLYYLFVALTLITTFFFDVSFEYKSILFYIFLLANIPFIFGGHIPFLSHFWSLGVEEQFYSFWPWVVKKSKSILKITVIICVALSARTQGTVRSINVKVGDKVYAGQVLAVMDDVGLSGAYAEISTQYSFAKEVYEKQKSLWEQQVGSEMQYLQARNNMVALQKRMSATSAQLDLSRIKAPVSGTVDAVNIKIGQAVMPGMPAISVVNLSSLKVTGNVGESLIGKVNTGDPVMIYFPDLK
ncbi:MAG: efflux RND transporter periplasmic adaptor subunit, partial [Bacteroidota bacterium]